MYVPLSLHSNGFNGSNYQLKWNSVVNTLKFFLACVPRPARSAFHFCSNFPVSYVGCCTLIGQLAVTHFKHSAYSRKAKTIIQSLVAYKIRAIVVYVSPVLESVLQLHFIRKLISCRTHFELSFGDGFAKIYGL